MATYNYYHWTMPDGSVIKTTKDEPPEGWIPPGPGPAGPAGAAGAAGAQGPQGAPGRAGLDALPQAWDPRYGWANPYMSTEAPAAALAPQQPQSTPLSAISPNGYSMGMNPISLMSKFSGYTSPQQLMSMDPSSLRPGTPSWKI